MVGVASNTFCATPSSINPGICSSASAVEGVARQEHHHQLRRAARTLPSSSSTRACGRAPGPAPRAAAAWPRVPPRPSLSSASRYAPSGALASTTMFRPPGSRTTMSGRRRPSSPVDRDLLLEVAVLEHARQLDHPPELDLPPAAAHRRRLERAHQACRSRRAASPASSADRLHLLADGAVGGAALALHRAHLLVHLLQRGAHRRDHPFDRLLLRLLPRLELG